MARFLVFSHDGAGLALAYRLKQDGHQVTAWIESPKFRHLYGGLLKRVADYHDALDNDPICVFDSVGIGVDPKDRPDAPAAWASYDPLSEQLKRKGYRVIGASALADRMEFDRTWGAELANEAGLVVPETHGFEDFDEAIDFVKAKRGRYIYKPHSNQEVFTNYPAESWEDMLVHLTEQRDRSEAEGVAPPTFELQAFVSGQQMSIEGWWTGEHFVSANSTFEFKPLMHGDIGPYTGECGSVIFYYPPGASTKMQADVLDKLTPVLSKLHYPPGPLDVNCLVNEHGAHFLEFTARFGYPALYIQLEAITSNLGDDLEALANGDDWHGFQIKPAHWFTGVRVVIPAWPYGHTEKAFRRFPFFQRVTPAQMEHIQLVDAYFDGERLRSGGTDGELMCVTGSGQTIPEAKAKVHDLLNQIKLYPMYWRDDIGDGIKLEELARWGYWVPNPT